MTKHMIQFSQLEEFMTEPFVPGQVVRVAVLEISEGVSAQIPDLRQVSVGVHVRTIQSKGHILACYLRVARIQLYNGRRDGDPTWQKYDAVWAQAAALKERVLAYLQAAAAERGFTVRAAGVIDLGETRLLPAKWLGDPAAVGAGGEDHQQA